MEIKRIGFLGLGLLVAEGMVLSAQGTAQGFPGAFVTSWCGLKGWDKVRRRGVYQPFIRRGFASPDPFSARALPPRSRVHIGVPRIDR